MSGEKKIPSQSDRPALPRDAFRAQRAVGIHSGPAATAGDMTRTVPLVVMPDYAETPAVHSHNMGDIAAAGTPPPITAHKDKAQPIAHSNHNPFAPYGERSQSRPYALRFPDPIDRVLRHLAAEERTHPLRIIDQILHDHLQRIGRLPRTD